MKLWLHPSDPFYKSGVQPETDYDYDPAGRAS
jgi:hypothetical protein